MTYQNLAYRMRPQNLSDILGQSDLLGPGKFLDRMCKSGQYQSIILYGPPGTGKTSIAYALSKENKLPFADFNAATDDKKKLQTIIKNAQKEEKPTVLFLDEIHRLTKPNQELLLPYLEQGLLIMVGATTDNPYMIVQPAIRSRSRILQLHPLSNQDIVVGLKRALTDKKRGLGDYPVQINDSVLEQIAQNAQGDLRVALTALEMAVLSTPTISGTITITPQIIQECLQKPSMQGDAGGDTHYNLLSALQKSIRGSDTDAALYYLAQLLRIGDLESAVRRLSIIGFEDISFADPQAVIYANQAIELARKIGLPEAKIPLSNAVIALALAPKSNAAYVAIGQAWQLAEQIPVSSMPDYLKDGHYKGAKELGHSVGYKYPHDYPYHWTPQQYLPDELKDVQLFHLDPTSDYTEQLDTRYQKLKELQKQNLSQNR